VAGPVSAPTRASGGADPGDLPYDRRLAQRLASDLLAARAERDHCRAELDRSRAELDRVRARSEQQLADCQARERTLDERHARELADLKATETWRVGAAVVALPRWVRTRLKRRSR
jgi:multidrug resistance efflux pump